MLPSGDAEEKASNYGPVTIQVVSIPSDRYLSREQARQLAGLPPDEPQPEPVDLTPTMIEDLRPEGGPPKLVINNDPDSAA